MIRTKIATKALLGAALLVMAMIAVATPAGRAQDSKATDVSKVVRLNRAPVNKDVLRVQLPRPTVVKLP
ncbi:MAG TPA: hypothetical protein VIY69_09605, partial [Candidatus Acidoferrales bacterium]